MPTPSGLSRGRSRNFKKGGGGGGSSRIFFKRGGGGGNHLLGAICIGNKQILSGGQPLTRGNLYLKRGGGPPGPLDLPLLRMHPLRGKYQTPEPSKGFFISA